MQFPPRYLTSFAPKKIPHFFTDILIIGSGIAGLRAALEIPTDLQALVVTKDTLQQSNSAYAQGGIAGVLDPGDTISSHVKDTLIAGAGLCDQPIVERVVEQAPDQIYDLIRFGTKFDEENGELALTLEGGHSHRRVVHALGDATGREVMRAMVESTRQAANLELWDRTTLIDLLTDNGNCVGAIVNRSRRGRIAIWAKQTILASGGAGMVYRETTNPPVATGDGMAAAYRAGAKLQDMEFTQFHPTILYVAGSSRYLISEAVRGEGAYLRDRDGYRFVPEEDPRAELAPRDVVARAIFRCMLRTQHPNVYLDLSHIDPELVRQRFPGISKVCRSFGLDITTDRIPVRPGAHYSIGGVKVDEIGKTSIEGLWAAGEVSSTGLHGANRLASNSLIEGLVYGTSCAKGVIESARALPDRWQVLPLTHQVETEEVEPLDISDVTNALRSMMVRKMGIVRDRETLLEAERSVAFWCRYALGRELNSRAGWELQNMLILARLMIDSALKRTESRGTHYRSDYPETDDKNWQRHLVCPSTIEE